MKKLKEFGLIIALPQEDDARTVKLCHSLKKAHIPVVLFQFSKTRSINQVKIGNENEDLFIGARCRSSREDIKEALSSGAHFIVLPPENEELIKESLANGIDLIVEADNIEQISQLNSWGVEALMIDSALDNFEALAEYITEKTHQFLLLLGGKELVLPKKWGENKQFIAYIIDNFTNSVSEDRNYADAVSLVNRLMGMKFLSLSLRPDSEKFDEAQTFVSLTAIPLFTQGKRDLLTISVDDMDRTIAHMKWRNLYMDPFSAKMDGQDIIETELYQEFLGWKVKLINSMRLFPAD